MGEWGGRKEEGGEWGGRKEEGGEWGVAEDEWSASEHTLGPPKGQFRSQKLYNFGSAESKSEFGPKLTPVLARLQEIEPVSNRIIATSLTDRGAHPGTRGGHAGLSERL